MIFELSATILERIVFAMEDQSRSMLVDLETGELLPRSSETAAADSGRYVSPPEWTPADGFKLMESFCARVRNIETKHALMRALSHGKGVFKAFRTVLAADPEADIRFRDYKNAALRRHIESWLDDQREALGLARLGPEPEDFSELLDEEFSIEMTTLSQAPFDIAGLVAEVRAESAAWIPPILAALEEAELLAFIETHGTDGFLHYLPDAQGVPEGKPTGAAFGAMETAGGRPLGIVRFIHASRDFRELGLELLLLDSLRQRFVSAGAEQIVISSSFLIPRLASQLQDRGSTAYGFRYLVE